MIFERSSFKPEEIAERLEGLADAVKAADPDVVHLHADGLFWHLMDQCCERAKIRSLHALAGGDVERLRSLAAKARSGSAGVREIWLALQPLLDGLFH